MSNIIERLTSIEQKINTLSMRERGIVFCVSIFIVYMIWNTFFYAPVSSKKESLEKRLEASMASLKLSSAEETVLTAALKNDPNANKRREIKRLEKSIKALENEMLQMSSGLILAEHFPKLMSQMLIKEKGIEILDFNMLATQELLLPLPNQIQEKNDEREQDTQQAKLYKHAVDFKIRANFFETIKYLKKLEAMEWKVYWGKLDYKVDEYPDAIIHIVAYSISTSKGKFGE